MQKASLWGSNTMGQVCAAAVRIFYQRGYHAATMRGIAKQAGIRAPSIYNYFPTKEALLYHVMVNTLTALREQVEAALAESPPDPATRLSTFVREHIRFHIEHAPEAAVVDNELRGLSEQSRPQVVALRDEYEAILRELLREGVDRGIFTESDVKLASISILTMCTSVDIWYQIGGPLSPEEVAQAYARFVLRMVGCAEDVLGVAAAAQKLDMR